MDSLIRDFDTALNRLAREWRNGCHRVQRSTEARPLIPVVNAGMAGLVYRAESYAHRHIDRWFAW